MSDVLSMLAIMIMAVAVVTLASHCMILGRRLRKAEDLLDHTHVLAHATQTALMLHQAGIDVDIPLRMDPNE